ncbi:MAG: transcription antitermination factor NusB [Akkermansiaceae bacterium]
MHKRRDIREAAIQFLYLADFEGGPEPCEMQESFWEIIQENSIRKLNKAKAKAMLHISQGRNARVAKLVDHSTLLKAQLKAADGTAKLATALHQVLTKEGKLSAALDQLSTASHNKSDSIIGENLFDDVCNANSSLKLPRTEWQRALEDFPAWKNKAEAVSSAITQLERISARLESLNGDNNLGFDHIQSAAQEISQFREETETLVNQVLNHKSAIDEHLQDIVENYSPSRIDPVDRAILRLGAYEILHCGDIPRAVSINEAIEVAKRYGTNDSARFINGILDAVK